MKPLQVVFPSRADPESPVIDLDLHLPLLCFRPEKVLQVRAPLPATPEGLLLTSYCCSRVKHSAFRNAQTSALRMFIFLPKANIHYSARRLQIALFRGYPAAFVSAGGAGKHGQSLHLRSGFGAWPPAPSVVGRVSVVCPSPRS